MDGLKNKISGHLTEPCTEGFLISNGLGAKRMQSYEMLVNETHM